MSEITKIRLSVISILINIGIALFFYAYTQNVRAMIREELSGYVTHTEFQTYQTSHREWSDQVIKRLEDGQQMLLLQSQENNALLLKLLQQSPKKP